MNRNFTSRFGVLILVAMLSVGLPVPAAMAAPPLDVHITVLATIDITIDDPFLATGPAVDAGLLCPSGYQHELSVKESGPPSDDSFRILRIVKRFVCDDLTGTFDLKLIVRLDLVSGNTTAQWNVVGGTGAYAGLHGNGKLIGTAGAPGTILDEYDGKLH